MNNVVWLLEVLELTEGLAEEIGCWRRGSGLNLVTILLYLQHHAALLWMSMFSGLFSMKN